MRAAIIAVLLLEGEKLTLELILPSLHGCIDGSLVPVSPHLLLSCTTLICPLLTLANTT